MHLFRAFLRFASSLDTPDRTTNKNNINIVGCSCTGKHLQQHANSIHANGQRWRGSNENNNNNNKIPDEQQQYTKTWREREKKPHFYAIQFINIEFLDALHVVDSSKYNYIYKLNIICLILVSFNSRKEFY